MNPSLPAIPLSSRPGFLIRRLHQIHYAIFLEECRDFNITPVQYGALSALSAAPGLDQKALGMVVGLDRTTTADVLKRLAERGLITRQKNSNDGRARNAFLTANGKQVTEAMYVAMLSAQERFMVPLAPNDRDGLLGLLRILVDSNNEFGRASMHML